MFNQECLKANQDLANQSTNLRDEIRTLKIKMQSEKSGYEQLEQMGKNTIDYFSKNNKKILDENLAYSRENSDLRIELKNSKLKAEDKIQELQKELTRKQQGSGNLAKNETIDSSKESTKIQLLESKIQELQEILNKTQQEENQLPGVEADSEEAGRLDAKIKNTFEKLFERLCDKTGIESEQYTKALQDKDLTLLKFCNQINKYLAKKEFK